MNPIPVNVRIKRLTETAIVPTYGSFAAAGADLHADVSHQLVIEPGGRATIPTGIAMEIPPHLALFVCPRSGLSAKSGITVHNGPGVIDGDYRGGIGVILHNTTHQQFVVNPGDRIAQGVIVPVFQAIFEEVSELDDTDRGTGGFGSTGVSAVVTSEQITVGSLALSPTSQMAYRALAQDMADRRRLERANKPLPTSITKFLQCEPEEAASLLARQ